MKVSMIPKTVKTSNGEAETEYQVEETKGNGLEDWSDPFDKFESASSTPKTDEPEVDPFDEHIAFFGPASASSADFEEVVVPEVAEILSDPNLDLEYTERLEFYELIEKKYHELESNIKASIEKLKEAKENLPQAASIYQEVIVKRKEALEKIKDELAKIEPLKNSLLDIFEQERDLLISYGKDRYKWSLARKNGDIYKDGEKATYANKPNPFDYNIDINGDAIIGNPETSNWVIATKTVNEDGQKIEIHDVIDKNLKKPIIFSATGEPIGTDSNKDKNFHWTISDANLNLVTGEEGLKKDEVVLELASTDPTCASGGLTQAPIAIKIPEYIRIDDATGRPVDGNIIQEGDAIRMATAKGEGWTLKRVVKVKVESEPSTNAADGYDYIIKILGDENAYTPMMTIRIRGTAGMAASKRALALIAASEKDDPNYKRTSGINIDAYNMKAEAEFTLKPQALENIKMEYGIGDDMEEPSKFNSAISNFMNTYKDTGLITEGFVNAGFVGTSGNDILLFEEAVEEYAHQNKDGLGSEEVMSPLYTNAVDGRGGFNAIFHKKGNVFANKIGLFWGGEGDDNLFINTQKDQQVYINTFNHLGHTEIGNFNDDPEMLGFGNKSQDDFYGISTANYAFANWYEPEVYDKYGKGAGVPEAPDINNIENYTQDPNDFADVPIASIADIKYRVDLQISEQYKALKDLPLEETDEEEYDLSAINYGSGPFADMKSEMDTFFEGWSNQFGGTINDNTIPAFDDKNEEDIF